MKILKILLISIVIMSVFARKAHRASGDDEKYECKPQALKGISDQLIKYYITDGDPSKIVNSKKESDKEIVKNWFYISGDSAVVITKETAAAIEKDHKSSECLDYGKYVAYESASKFTYYDLSVKGDTYTVTQKNDKLEYALDKSGKLYNVRNIYGLGLKDVSG